STSWTFSPRGTSTCVQRGAILQPIVALIPSERGMHYSEVGFRNVRLDTYRKAGIEGDFRVLRRTHEQILMDRLEAQGRKDVSAIEIAAKRLRHTPQVALGHYV
ncbi:MAG TPA: hypothetical protein VNP71_06735, partial [Thermoplasmata archaeon]|nr:hypothetical protein [Thermoplasmata archaeon]